MGNGKIHGEFSSNRNYSESLYLCDGGVWLYWKLAEPASLTKVKKVNVNPGQICNKLVRIVESTNYGTLVCEYIRVGILRALLWVHS